MTNATPHTFVIPAYKSSTHLESCIRSLLAQTVKSRILIATSTPTEEMRRVATQHGIEICINDEAKGIASDWNFALSQGGSGWVTLAHQDDVYRPEYAEACMKAVSSHPDAIAVFTDYAEMVETDENIRDNTTFLRIKRMLLWPYQLKRALKSRVMKTWALRFGSPICCPAVTFNRKNMPDFRFDGNYTLNMDWEAWLRLAQHPGRMVFVRKRLCLHRIHAGSETSSGIKDNRRAQEDLRMFERLWPKWIAKGIAGFYKKGYASNG